MNLKLNKFNWTYNIQLHFTFIDYDEWIEWNFSTHGIWNAELADWRTISLRIELGQSLDLFIIGVFVGIEVDIDHCPPWFNVSIDNDEDDKPIVSFVDEDDGSNILRRFEFIADVRLEKWIKKIWFKH